MSHSWIPGARLNGLTLFFIVGGPSFLIWFHVTMHSLDGSFGKLWQAVVQERTFGFLYDFWPDWQLVHLYWIFVFFAWQILLLKTAPGFCYQGPVTPSGHVPVYYANGLFSYLATLVLFLFGIYFGHFPATVLYDNLGSFIAVMNALSLGLAFGFYFKGVLQPSTADCTVSSNPISDFYAGIELHPFLYGVDLKHLLVTRIGMMFWGLFGISAIFKQIELYDFNSDALILNVALQIIYLLKFYAFEHGFFTSIDMKENRVGFYQCWRSLAFIPSVYTSHTAYLVPHLRTLGAPICLLLFSLGIISMYGTYKIDSQRYNFRKTNARCKIWNSDPFFITAKYQLNNGQSTFAHILGSGYWGTARHLNYTAEVGAALAWTIPVCARDVLPYFYAIYLIGFLFDRARRDDARCRKKYGKNWDIYCKRVPYLFVPGVL